MDAYTDNWTRKFYRDTFKYLVAEVARATSAQTEVFTRQKAGAIGWKSEDHGGWFSFGAYNEVTYRLTTGRSILQLELPKRFWVRRQPTESYRTELSFHFSELGSIQGSDLVRFVEDCSCYCDQPELIYRWPLFFASGKWNPHYAWTELGKIEQTKREHTRHTEPRTYCSLSVSSATEPSSVDSK